MSLKQPIILLAITFCLLMPVTSSSTITEGIVGIVNNEVILLSELEDHIYQSKKNTTINKDKSAFLKELIDIKILEIQGKKMGIVVTDDRLDLIVGEIKKNNGEKKFVEELKKSNSNIYRLRFELTFQILQENISQAVLKNKIVITNREIEKYYIENFGEINKENLIKIREIKAKKTDFIGDILDIFNQPSDNLDVKLTKLEEGGYLKEEPRDLGYINPEELSEQIYNESQNAKVGDLIGPIKIEDEATFFVVENKIFSDPSFITMKNDIRNILYETKSISLLDSWFSDLRKSFYISQRL